VGPSSGALKLGPAIDRFGPASLGSVFQAVELGYNRIGLVDGLFGNVPSVWHKEILFAIAMGTEVVGSSSIGALRAAELFLFGMKGIGKIFRYYRREILVDDDEVCLSHGVAEVKFAPVSTPMINIRLTLKCLEKSGQISRSEREAIVASAKAKHFSQRTIADALADLRAQIPVDRIAKITKLFHESYVDQKYLDYVLLVGYLEHSPHLQPRASLDWSRIVTRKWAPQFEDGRNDLPSLEGW
jgi:hypothetical protein